MASEECAGTEADTGVDDAGALTRPASDARLLTLFCGLYHGVLPSSSAPLPSDVLRSAR